MLEEVPAPDAAPETIAEEREAIVSGGFSDGREVNLLGRPLGPLGLDRGSLRLELGAWQIRTVQLRR